jgi:hypothetical protein
MSVDRSWKGLKPAILRGLLDHEHFFVTRAGILHCIEPERISDIARAVMRFAGLPEPPSITDELRAFCREWDIEFEFRHHPMTEGVIFTRGGSDWPAWALARATASQQRN